MNITYYKNKRNIDRLNKIGSKIEKKTTNKKHNSQFFTPLKKV